MFAACAGRLFHIGHTLRITAHFHCFFPAGLLLFFFKQCILLEKEKLK